MPAQHHGALSHRRMRAQYRLYLPEFDPVTPQFHLLVEAAQEL
jgi:hypothetical protein